jgi:protein-L-isoaspartate(D-aspartate) O-methyltransferase
MAHDEHFVDAARSAGVADQRVLDALAAVDRNQFVPSDWRRSARRDVPVPLPCNQTTSQPSLVALMVEALEPRPSDRVLEIGTGYGFEAAILAQVVDQVWTVEWWPELAEQAARNLAAAGITNAHVVTGDGSEGLPSHAPYDAIVIAARADAIPAQLQRQLAIGGRLVAPLGPAGSEQCAVLTKESNGVITVVRTLGPVRFVPLLEP